MERRRAAIKDVSQGFDVWTSPDFPIAPRPSDIPKKKDTRQRRARTIRNKMASASRKRNRR